MRITLVTLSFNQRKFLAEAIDSVLQQNYPNLEYIVVDPGSSDGSRELLQSYPGISKTILERDRGPADGLNKGFEEATGEVFGFLNADDILFADCLRQVSNFFEQHPKCDMVMGNGFIIDEQGRHIRHVKARDFTVRRYLHGGAKFLQQSTFFRREPFLRSPRFNLSNRTCWDGELFVQMRSHGASIGYIDADLAGFRIHGASITGSGNTRDIYKVDCQRIFREIQGRDWGTVDQLIKCWYRGEGLCRRVLEMAKRR